MIGYQDKINQILRGAETIKNRNDDIEEKDFEFDIFKNVIEQVIKNNKLDLDVFKSAQSEIDKAQIEFNNATLDLIKDIYKTLIIGFSLLIILMLVTWGYLTYTHFNH
jgi:glycosylphosphatidylinositol transamidase (GPIT) subunit GPI8